MLDKLPNTALKLSWKQKLIAVTAITLVGLIALAISAFLGLNSVNNSFKKQKIAVEYKQNSLSMVTNLLKLESTSSSLTTDDTGNFISDLSLLEKHITYMQDHSSSLGYTELNEYSNQLAELTNGYIKQRTAWADNRKELGFNAEEGQIVLLIGAMTTLEKASSSFTEGPVVRLAEQQRKYLITLDEESEANIEAAIEELNQLVARFNWQEYPIGKNINAYQTIYENTRVLINRERQILNTLLPVTTQLTSTVEKQNTFLEDTAISQAANEANNARKAALQIIAVVAIIVGLISLFSLGNIARQLTIQLNQMQDFLKGIAKGDFSQKLSTNDNENDEFTQLRTASNQMVHDISGVISQVVNGNDELSSIRNQLEKAVEQLGITSEEVEQKTQQSTVATQQISIAVNDVAKRSVDVSETAQSASKATQTGGKVVNDCVVSMENIVKLIENTHQEVANLAQSSSQMLGIIDVINGLADQTNLLALNAAIESARAGEAGRGFSVVADEVRALAQKTVNATSSIGDIIKNFNDQSKRMGNLMEEGIKLASSGQNNANNAAESFESIEEHIQKVAAEMDQVVVAVEEISYNTNDIATQVEHICGQSESTKKTRHTLEEHTHHISSQSETLGQLTSRFKLSN